MHEEANERIDDGEDNLWIKCFLKIGHIARTSLKQKYVRNIQDVRRSIYPSVLYEQIKCNKWNRSSTKVVNMRN